MAVVVFRVRFKIGARIRLWTGLVNVFRVRFKIEKFNYFYKFLFTKTNASSIFRSLCLTLAVRCTCGWARRSPWTTGNWPSNWHRSCGIESMITLSATLTL